MSRVSVFLSVFAVLLLVVGSVTAQKQPEPYNSKPKDSSEKKSDQDKKSDEDQKPDQGKSQEAKETSTKPTTAAKDTTSDAIKRATFTTAVVDREPTDDIDSLSTAADQIFFFTEVVGMQGKQITHRWIYGDKVMAEVPFEIGGQRWRVYSSKKLLPAWAGTWKVDVVDDAGKTLREDTFVYVASAQ